MASTSQKTTTFFDEKTRKIIDADMEKMAKSKSSEVFSILNREIRKSPKNEEEWNQKTLDILMDLAENMEEADDDDEEEFERRIVGNLEADSSSTIRQRKPEAPPTPKPRPPAKNSDNDHPTAGIPLDYVVYRVIFMIFAIFIIPFVTNYFRQ